MLAPLDMVRPFCTAGIGGGAQPTGFYASLRQMVMMPSRITMTIAATRIHRSLSHFASPPNTYEILLFDLSSRSLWFMSS